MPECNKRAAERGTTIVEIAIVLTLLVLGLLAQAAVTVTSYNQSSVNEERRLALAGARERLEILRGYDLRAVFPAFDESTANDPPDAPGPYFDIAGLRADPADPIGRVGRVLFPVGPPPPTSPVQDPVLREDAIDAMMKMPADLDGDGVIDDQPKDTTYIHLPVTVEIRWKGRMGPQRLRLTTWLVPREKEAPPKEEAPLVKENPS